MNHTILKNKLFKCGVSGKALEWVEDYLNLRQQQTQANNNLSGKKPVPCGIPQGSVLGPLLFLAYINDVELTISNTTPYMYADDLALHTTGKDLDRICMLLQTDTSAVGDWCQLNELTVNMDKTKVMWYYPINTTP